MLIARPEGWTARRWRIEREDGELVAALEVPLLREGGRLVIGDRIHRVEREGLMSGPWVLLDGDQLLFEADKPSAIRNRFMVTVKGAPLELSPTSWTLRSFRLVGPDWVEFGQIRRPSWLSRRVEIDLSDLVPLEAQLFLFVLAMVLWRRADAGA